MSGKYEKIVIVITAFRFHGGNSEEMVLDWDVVISNGSIPVKERQAVRVSCAREFIIDMDPFFPEYSQEGNFVVTTTRGYGVVVHVFVHCFWPRKSVDPEGAERIIEKYLNPQA